MCSPGTVSSRTDHIVGFTPKLFTSQFHYNYVLSGTNITAVGYFKSASISSVLIRALSRLTFHIFIGPCAIAHHQFNIRIYFTGDPAETAPCGLINSAALDTFVR